MYDNYNYPEGSDTPDAPWNQIDPPELEVTVNVIQTLYKDEVTIIADDYVQYDDGEVEFDNKFIDEFVTNQALTPIKILQMLPEVYEELLSNVDSKHLSKLKLLVDGCKDWKLSEQETDVVRWQSMK